MSQMINHPNRSKKEKEESQTVIAYKGFDKNLRCRDFQFEVGKSYEAGGTIKVCGNGFHACENPFDVWSYYGAINSRFAVVELSGALDRHSEDSKIAAAKITVTVELTLPDFIQKAVAWVVNATKGRGDDPGGASARIGSSGASARIGSSGASAQIGSSGASAQIGSSGAYARIGSSGAYAQIGSSGAKSVIASAGYNATAKGADGTWLSLAEFDGNYECVGFATGCIGRDGLKPDTFYRAKGGKLVEVE